MPGLYREKRRVGASACFAVTVEGGKRRGRQRCRLRDLLPP